MTPIPPRERLRPLFLRAFGVVAFIAFVSLGVQLRLLIGEEGLLPIEPFLQFARERLGTFSAIARCPTLSWIDASDASLVVTVIAGCAVSAMLIFLVAPRWCCAAIWVLYLSLTTDCRDFLSFQWDNLLIESAFFAAFYAPGGWRPFRGTPPPAAWGSRFLLIWILFRLHFESGLAKLHSGDPHWRDLTAMVSYYETAPLPTPLGWWVHQLPEWAHRFCSGFTLFVELVVPWLLFGPYRARLVAVAFFVPFQISIECTGNYGIFNILALALCIPALRDPTDGIAKPRRRPAVAFTSICVALTILDCAAGMLRFEPPEPLASVESAVAPFRTFNTYHLFAQMTLERREVEIRGSDDGKEWKAYEFRYKPGDPTRAPRFVAPHQPRVDFRFWFLPLRDRTDYLNRLVDRIARRPDVVAPLWEVDPFAGRSPRYVRIALWKYVMTDPATRLDTGRWWNRELVSIHPYVHDCSSGKPPRF